MTNKPTIPTKVSDLLNDSGYLTEHQDISGKVDKVNGKSLISDDEIKRLSTLKNYDDTNIYLQLNDIESEINELKEGNIDIDLTNYVTKSELSEKADKSELHSHNNKSVLDGITSDKIVEWNNKSVFSGNYNDLTNKPTIPTKVSELTNDEGYLNSIPDEYVKISDLDDYISNNGGSSHSHTNMAVLDAITSEMTTKWNKSIPFEDSAVDNANSWLTNGYTKTSTTTSNLPSACIDDDKWGVLFFLAENSGNRTGTQMYFPIDGTYKGRIFTRSVKNGTTFSSWFLLSTFDGDYNSLTNKPTIPTDVSWDAIIEKPTTFEPSSHNHSINDISDYPNDLATRDYVVEAINNAKLEGGDVQIDLSIYAKKTDLHDHSNKTILDTITSEATTKWNKSIPFEDSAVGNANSWLTNGYTKTSTSTSNLPSVCTGSDRWGVLFFLAENSANGTGTQMYFPIDGTYKGRIFTRSITNRSSFSSWFLLSTFDGDYNSLTNKPVIPTKTSQLTNDEGYLVSIPSEYVTDSELNSKGYLTEHQDISGKVDFEVVGEGITVPPLEDCVDAEIRESINEINASLEESVKFKVVGEGVTVPPLEDYDDTEIRESINEINTSLEQSVKFEIVGEGATVPPIELTQKRFDMGTSGKITFKAHLNNGYISLKGLANSYSSQSNIIDSVIGAINNKCGIVNKNGFYQNLTVSYEASGYDYTITVSGFANYSIVDVYLNIGSYFIE